MGDPGLLKEEAPTVSVCMAVLNARPWVREAVESILNQTLTDLELIIVDDGSTDGSLDVLEELAAGDSRIRLSSGPHRGLGATRNRALEEAKGEFVAPMDADDRSLPERLERQVAFLREREDVVAVGTQSLWTDPEGAPLRRSENPTDHEEIEAGLLDGAGETMQHATTMIRREPMVEIGGYRDLVGEDFDLFLRLGEKARLANIDEVLYHYRQHRASTTHAGRDRMLDDARTILSEAYERRGLDRSVDDLDLPTQRHGGAYQHRTWAWWALRAGFVSSCRKHALKQLLRAPLERASWRLMYCAVRGR